MTIPQDDPRDWPGTAYIEPAPQGPPSDMLPGMSLHAALLANHQAYGLTILYDPVSEIFSTWHLGLTPEQGLVLLERAVKREQEWQAFQKQQREAKDTRPVVQPVERTWPEVPTVDEAIEAEVERRYRERHPGG